MEDGGERVGKEIDKRPLQSASRDARVAERENSDARFFRGFFCNPLTVSCNSALVTSPLRCEEAQATGFHYDYPMYRTSDVTSLLTLSHSRSTDTCGDCLLHPSHCSMVRLL